MFAGSKGGGGEFKQTPDNLRSNDTFEGVIGLCIGPIKGPTNGLKSVSLDGTAIENSTGQLNFPAFSATFADGDPLKYPQKISLKLGAGAAPTNVGLTFSNTTGSNPVWITRTLNNTNANFIDLRFIVQQLMRQDANGIYELGATLEIQMKPVGSTTWINPTLTNPTTPYSQSGIVDGLVRIFAARNLYDNNGNYIPTTPNFVIKGKTTGPAVYELRVAVPNEGPYSDTAWDIRVRLLERESYAGGNNGENQEKRTIAWESIAAVYSGILGEHEDWRGVSWLQLYGQASDQLTGVPEVTGTYDTKIVSVPSSAVYNPTTRQYTAGIWDGSWTKSFTTDPAWVINDAISDGLSGLSLIASGSYLNKWDALESSKWFSQLVPDGNGGTHPRYSMNLSISQPQKAEDLIRYLAGACGALAWDQGDGEWRMKVDKPEVAVDLFTLENIEGEFVYSHTDVDTRYNDIIGQFKNEEMDFRQDAVRLYDNPSIALLGRKPTTLVLVGCTNRQEAMRRVKLRLRAAVNENRIITFTTNRRGRNIEPLDAILIADGDLGTIDAKTTGRIAAINGDRMFINLRDPVRLEVGVPYTVKFTVPNPAYNPETATQPTSANWTKPTLVVSRAVTNTAAQRGNVYTIYLDAALPTDVATNMSVALEATGLTTMPRMYRVTNVMPQDDGERVAISAINIDVGKWDASDGVTKEDTVFQDLRGAVPTPTVIPDHPLLSLVRVPIEQGSMVNLQASWMRPAGAFISGFRVQYSVNGGALQTAVERQQVAEWELPNPGPGLYRVEICAMDRRGGYSPPLVGTLNVTQSLIDATQIYYNGVPGSPPVSLQDLKPAEANATEGAPFGTPIGDRPVEEVLDQLDGIVGVINVDLDAIRDEIQELFDTYGNTASAAASAVVADLAYQAAKLSAAAVLPADFTQNGRFWMSGYVGDPAAVTSIETNSTFSFPVIAGVGKVIQFNTGSETQVDVASIGVVKLIAGRKYRITARARALTNADSPSCQLHAIGLTTDYTYSETTISQTLPVGSGAWTDFVVNVDASTMLVSGDGTSVYFRAMFRGLGVNDNYQLAFMKVEDVSESVAANGFAQTALNYSDDAGQYAAAASVSQTTARLTVAASLPSDFQQDGKFWANASNLGLAPAARTSIVADTNFAFADETAEGRVIAITSPGSVNVGVTTLGVVSVRAGRTYRLRVRAKRISAAANLQILISTLDSTYTYVTVPNNNANFALTSSYDTYELVLPSSSIISAGGVYLRGTARFTSASGAAVARVAFVQLEDITESAAAQNYAQAAATSASTAGTAKTDAGNFATAAQDFSVLAEVAYTSTVAAIRNGPILPYNFATGIAEWTTARIGDPATVPSGITSSIATVVTNDSHFGPALEVHGFTAPGQNITTRGVITLVPGRYYEIKSRLKVTASDGSVQFNHVVQFLDASYAAFGTTQFGPAVTITGTGSVVEITSLVSAALINGSTVAWPGGSVYMRAGVRLQTSETGLVFRLGEVRVTDVTDRVIATVAATASAGSASSASTSAGDAGNYALASSNSATAASLSAGTATTKADTATFQASLATDAAASAQSSAILSASLGLNSQNPNPAFSSWTTPANPPDQWAVWTTGAGTTRTRVTGPRGGYAARFTVTTSTAECGLRQDYAANPTISAGTVTPGYYVLEAEVKLVSGSLVGSGLYFDCRNAAGSSTELFQFNFSTDPSNSSGVALGAGVAGRTYRFAKIVRVVDSTTTQCLFYAMGNWSNLGAANKVIEFNRASFRAATEAEITSKTVVADLVATVSTQAGVLVALNGRTTAYLEQVVAAGSSVAAVRLASQANVGSMLELQADAIRLGAAKLPAMDVVAGKVTIYGRLNVTGGIVVSPDGKTTMDLDQNRIVFNNGSVMKVTGSGFGSSNQFVSWFGPSLSSISLCTEANAKTFEKTNGDAYFGGALSAGSYTTKAGTTSISTTAEAETAVFASLGGTITVSLSYIYIFSGRTNYTSAQLAAWVSAKNAVTPAMSNTGGVEWSNSPSADPGPFVVYLYRSLNGAAYVQVATLTVTGTNRVTGWMPGGGDPGYLQYEDNAGGAITFTDPSNVAQSRQYKAVLASRGEKYGVQFQSISIVCVEQ